MRGLQQIKAAMLAIITNPKATRLEQIEAAKVLAACAGVLLPDANAGLLSTRQAVRLEQARKAIADRVQRQKERKRLENRRAYLRRKLRKQQEGHNEQQTGAIETGNNRVGTESQDSAD